METIVSPLIDLLEELYVGSAGKHTWVIDQKPGYGLSKTIAQVHAKQASTAIVKEGSTIAAHTAHLTYSIGIALQFFEGKMPAPNWPKSWEIKQVNDHEWKQLQEDLLEAYQKLKKAISARKDWSNPQFNQGTLALLPHVAYHLGAIKQLVITTNDI